MSNAPAKTNDLSWMTGGPQGSGVDSSANIFAGACALSGLWTFGSREYYSSIKGPHSYFEVRANSERVRSQVNTVNLLATFDAETLIRHADEVCPGGGIIYDPTFSAVEIDKVDTIEHPVVARVKDRLAKQGLPGTVAGILEEAKKRNVNLYPIPYNDIVAKTATQIGEHQLSKVSRIVNVLSVAASFAILGFDLNYLNQSIARTFGSKKKVIDMNEIGAKMAYDIAMGLPKQSFSYQLKPIQNQPRLLLMGNEAVALGKIVGGCRVQTYYPITPAADESEFIESHENFDLSDAGQPGKKGSVLVTQTEDEIAAITMAIGAALAGARAATSTSGPGFSLMVEGLGWAGMNEVPVVIHNTRAEDPQQANPHATNKETSSSYSAPPTASSPVSSSAPETSKNASTTRSESSTTRNNSRCRPYTSSTSQWPTPASPFHNSKRTWSRSIVERWSTTTGPRTGTANHTTDSRSPPTAYRLEQFSAQDTVSGTAETNTTKWDTSKRIHSTGSA